MAHDTFTIEFTTSELNFLGTMLSEHLAPWRVTNPLIDKINRQIAAQMQESKEVQNVPSTSD
jgi:hypothetical protein